MIKISKSNLSQALEKAKREQEQEARQLDMDSTLPVFRRAIPHLIKLSSKRPALSRQETYLSTTAFISSEQGLRPYMEDFYFCGAISQVRNKTDVELGQALADTLLKLGKTLKNEYSGSTCIAAMVDCGRVIVANVGDSRAILIHRRHPKEDFQATRLNWLHHPADPEERERIYQAGGHIMVYGVPRLNGSLAVSRALGDDMASMPGLSYEPTVSAIHPKADEAYLILCSDGLMEVLHEVHLGALFDANKQREKLADELRNAAYNAGSTDNITVMVIPIPGSAHDEMIVAVVADGHGGSKVARIIVERFYPVLKSALVNSSSA